MNSRLLFSLLTSLVCVCWSLTGEAVGQADDRPAIIENIESYVAAFNRRDVDAIVEHWSTTGELIAPDGELVVGREAIRGSFETLFESLTSDQLLTVSVDRISFVTADVAIEEGVAYVIGGTESNYVVTHKLEDGKWRIHSVREFARSSRSVHYEQLKDLEWMIGDWIDQSADAAIETSCKWSRNQNFITQNFKVSVPGSTPLEGMQVIGFDASTKTIRSWLFDSDGGTGSGVWSRKGDGWEVQLSQVLADGRTASATNVYELIDHDQFSWKSIGREVDGDKLPDSESVTVLRVVEEVVEDVVE